MGRILNFASGPAMLPLPVLEKAREEMLDYRGSGMSVMEMSHRGRIFDGIIKAAEANLRQLLGISDDYAVLFLPGGASQQFALVPLNLAIPGRAADFVDTGHWAGKARREAEIVGPVRVAWSGREANYLAAPRPADPAFAPDASYAYLCSNETIGGVRIAEFPRPPSPLVADMSSDLLSRAVEVDRFGLIFAGAQKNLGPSGLGVVIIRRDLAARAPDSLNLFFRYRTHIPEPSLYNTPNTWAVYIFKLITDWVADRGGVPALEETNEAKAELLYRRLDSSPFWRPLAQKDSRSRMNVTWRLANPELEDKFVREAKAAGMDGLKGHRSVGGLRASVYNAFPLEGVGVLVDFMGDFEKRNG
ncbi:MAG: 3-phosphoserine/phosphohydroxythreonine transaminase [Planctomycetota bacterium]|jgi:phosphoserine aminotransferase|nr:3-phosphoserine/phosphohydroxythreonine transaminase [Planctomycetota bacterium]